MIVELYYKGNNFWDINPEFRILDVFNNFYTKDKSKNKEHSSNIMWALAFCVRRESPMYNLPDKWELSAKDIVKDPKFKWSDYEDLVALFKSTYLTQAERSLLAWDELMSKRDKYLKEQDYYFDKYMIDEETGDNVRSSTGRLVIVKGTAEQLDKAFAVTPKMYHDFSKIKLAIEEDEIMKKGKGDKMLSLGDTGQI